jgi:small-conductance mechanosensitive channel
MDLSSAWHTFARLGNSLIAALPRFLVGAVIVGIAFFVGKLVRAAVRRYAHRRREGGSFELAIGRLVMAAAILVGILIGATVAFPTFTPADMVSALGIGGIAIGFAFKDIFQNFLAGILLLITKPFIVGDQIEYKDYEGTVEDIQTRATMIKTYDGRRVVIPNAELFINPVTVNTAFPQRRWEYDIGIGYGDDIEKARKIILDVLRDVETVDPDPQADAIVIKLDESSVNIRARWWSSSRIADVLLGQDKVLTEVKSRLQGAGIDLPYPTRQVLFHDQTESTDGIRAKQREGWPSRGKDDPPPRQRDQGGTKPAVTSSP